MNALSRWYRRAFGSNSQEPWRWQELANYNGRVAKGIVHEPQYVARMRVQQDAFDAEQLARYKADPNVYLLP